MDVDSSGEIDQLNALSFEMQSADMNFPREIEIISQNEMPAGYGARNSARGTHNKYGAQREKMKLMISTGASAGMHFSGIPDVGILNRMTICLHRIK